MNSFSTILQKKLVSKTIKYIILIIVYCGSMHLSPIITIVSWQTVFKITHYISDGPLISNISNQEDIVEGQDLIIYPVVHSNPAHNVVWWTRQHDANLKYGRLVFIINKIQRNDSDNYTCHVMNTLKPSGLDSMNTTSEWIVYVNVQCTYSVISNKQMYDHRNSSSSIIIVL